jgi:hypothetical protein
MVNAQNINFTDANFKTALLTTAYAEDVNGFPIPVDQNSDGEIQFSEAINIVVLIIDNANISNLEGIQAFFNLEQLSCMGNQITNLDLTFLPNLKMVNMPNNPITSLNLSGLPQLQDAYLDNISTLTSVDMSNCPNLSSSISILTNTLTQLNIGNCSSLTTVNVTSNNLVFLNIDGCSSLNNLSIWFSQLQVVSVVNIPTLTQLDFSYNSQLDVLFILNCPNITQLSCISNHLLSLDVTGLPNLNTLYCGGNLINSLNLNNSVNLTNLVCMTNQLNTLDVSNCYNLNVLFCDNNNLQSLFAKNGANESITVTNNPNLAFICADDSQVATVQNYLNANSMTNTVCDSYCSFVPGGNYNTITGVLTYDANNNGCDALDPKKSLIRLNINDGSNQGATFTNATGNYSFYTQVGNFAITPIVENPTWFTFSPTTATIPFANNNNNIVTQNFCIAQNGVHADLEIVISPITPARPGFDAVYNIVYKNKGNQTLSGGLSFTYNDSVLDFISATVSPSSQTTGVLNWNYINLSPFESRSIYVTLNVNSQVETPAVNIGDILNLNATITPLVGDEIPNDNSFPYNQTVVGSFDPNDITCLEGPTVSSSTIGGYLHYAINFENTGTFPAENVVVKTTIDPTKFDINSLQLLNTSNPIYARITGNVVEFIFESIQLEIGGHGHILLKIRSNSALVSGNQVSKRVDIFFDYNFPIDTGLANTTFQNLSSSVVTLDASISVFPNPAKSDVSIISNSTIKSIQLFDIQGRILSTTIVDEVSSNMDVSSYPNGVYFLKITTEKGSKVEKIIKE